MNKQILNILSEIQNMMDDDETKEAIHLFINGAYVAFGGKIVERESKQEEVREETLVEGEVIDAETTII